MRGGWLAVALAAAVAACGDNTAQGAIPRDRFVKANVALRSVIDTASAGDSLRAAALKQHRVTEKDLQRFVRVHQNDPEYLATVWREVADSVQRRYERERLGGRREGPAPLPPGMAAPDPDARPDSVLGMSPAGEPVMRPGPTPAEPRTIRPPQAPPPPPLPAGAAPRQQPGTRRPSPPPDTRRPMAPPERTARPTTP
ncbi:MAG TPA: hypothetical protein VGB15_15425 [Longimicrobium sp.]|jgi:hypothetical protein